MTDEEYPDWTMRGAIGLPDYQAQVRVAEGKLLPLTDAGGALPTYPDELSPPGIHYSACCADEDVAIRRLWRCWVREIAAKGSPPAVVHVSVRSHRVDAHGHVVLVWSQAQRCYRVVR